MSVIWRLKRLDLNENFSLIPLTYDFIADINELANKGEDPAHAGFALLSKSVEVVLKENSFTEPIGYFEIAYRNGQGIQIGIGYSRGEIIEGPIMTKTTWDAKEVKFVDIPSGKGAINIVLYKLGLPERKDMSGFENLGLSNYSSNKKILRNL